MEMCVDNPRQGFADLFATHPSIDSRVKALMDFAGGHDPGPLALPSEEDGATTPSDGPWGPSAPPAAEPAGGTGMADQPADKPFLPARPPIELGGDSPPRGPWNRG
jgi:heat shock protein HtpX